MTLHFSDNSSITAEGYWLYGLGITRLGARGNISCPEGFVPVPGNPEFNTQAFCVAQYEMTYTDADTPDSCHQAHPETCSWWEDANTVRYITWKPVVSMPWKYPISNITQQQAIDACKSIWPGYHLITNNQWMTLARNIESIAGETIIFNWVSWNSLWCPWNWGNSEPRWNVTKTWPGNDPNCNERRKYQLSNGSIVWDIAWNVSEHVNKANNISWAWYNIWWTTISWTSSPTNWDDDGIYAEEDMQRYGSALYLWSSLWRGNISQQVLSNNIYIRWGTTAPNISSGIYSLILVSGSSQSRLTWFRCTR